MAQAAAPGFVELSDFPMTAPTMPDGTGADVQWKLGSLLQGMGIESMPTNIVRGVAIDASRSVAALAALADPLFAVGCFFLGVHAFRHTRRLACTRRVIEPPPAPAGFAARILRVHALSLPLMWPTALCLWPLCSMLGGLGAEHLATASIAFYMISTLPHHLLGLRLPKPGNGALAGSRRT